MNDSFAEEVKHLHQPATRLVGQADGTAVTEVFAEHSFREHLTLSYGHRSTHGGPSELYDHEELAGMSVRSISDSANNLFVVDSLDPAALQESPYASDGHIRTPGDISGSLDLPPDAAAATSLDEKRHLLRAAADAALSLEPSLHELEISFQGFVRCVCVWASDIQPALSATTYSGIRIFASKGAAATHAVAGAPGGIGHFLDETPESIAKTCIVRLRAIEDAPPRREITGEMPVILEGGWGGVWLHEAVGHLLEADTDSPYAAGDLGGTIGSSQVTVVDDGSWTNGRGACSYDDEGMPTRRTVLVDRGVLTGLMTDRRTARRKDLPRTANGRRQDYRHPPLPRMTNLLLENGTSTPSDLIKDVPSGLYVRMIGSGEVRPADDHFHFDVMEGYLIEGGELTSPATALRISGKPSDMLRRLTAVGNDLTVDPGRGTCMKAGQTVAVSVGMPTVLLDRLTVEPAHKLTAKPHGH